MNKLSHPLGGCNFNSYMRTLAKHRPWDLKQGKRLLILAIWNLLRSPSTWLEARYCQSKLSNLQAPDNPVFIVGHWRSGTTYLYHTLAQDSQFQYVKFVHQILPWNFLNRSSLWVKLFEKDIAKRDPSDYLYLKTIDSPSEDEMAWGNMGLPCMTSIFYFPQLRREIFRRSVLLEDLSPEELQAFAEGHQYFCKKVLLENPNKRLLMKNPTNTARIGWLKKLYPKAQFIHIYRNPFCVFSSMSKGTKKVFPRLALQNYEEMNDTELQLSILEFYRLLYERFFEEVKQLPAEDIYQLRFEDFEADPINEVAKIYRYFNWTGWDSSQGAMEQFYSKLRHYAKDSHTLTPKQIALVQHYCQLTLETWGYTFPDSVSIKEE